MAIIKIFIFDIDSFAHAYCLQPFKEYTHYFVSYAVAEWARSLNPDYTFACTHRRSGIHEVQMKQFAKYAIPEKGSDVTREKNGFFTANFLKNFHDLAGLTGKLQGVSCSSDRNRKLNDSYENEIKPFELNSKFIANAQAIPEFDCATKTPQIKQILDFSRANLRKNPEDTFEVYIGDDRADLCCMTAHFPPGPDYKIIAIHFDNKPTSTIRTVPNGFLWEKYSEKKEELEVKSVSIASDQYSTLAAKIVNTNLGGAAFRVVKGIVEKYIITGKPEDLHQYIETDKKGFINCFAAWMRENYIHLPAQALAEAIDFERPTYTSLTLKLSHQFINENLSKQLDLLTMAELYEKNRVLLPDTDSDDDSSEKEKKASIVKSCVVNVELKSPPQTPRVKSAPTLNFFALPFKQTADSETESDEEFFPVRFSRTDSTESE